MMMRRFLMTGILMGVAVSAMAEEQDPGAPPVLPPPPKWESSVTLGVTITRGNSKTTLFTGNAQTQFKGKKNELLFGVDGAYGENNSVRNTAFIHAYGQYNYLFTDRFFGLLRVDGLHDDIAEVAYRITVAPGVGYYFIKEKMTTLAGEVGPGVVFEKQGGVSRTYATIRLAERFEHKFQNGARVWQSFEFLPQVDKIKNFIANLEIGVEAPLTKKLSVSLILQDSYDNQPAPGRLHNDLKIISGLKYKF